MMEVFHRKVLRRCSDPDKALEIARKARRLNGPMVIVERHSGATVRPYRVVSLRALDLDGDDGEGWSE